MKYRFIYILLYVSYSSGETAGPSSLKFVERPIVNPGEAEKISVVFEISRATPSTSASLQITIFIYVCVL